VPKCQAKQMWHWGKMICEKCNKELEENKSLYRDFGMVLICNHKKSFMDKITTLEKENKRKFNRWKNERNL